MTQERYRLIHGDCLATLPTLPTLEGIDAVVTDPPWGVSQDCDNTRFSQGKKWPHRCNKNVMGDDRAFDPTPWLAFQKVALFGFQAFSNRLPCGSVLVWNKRHESMVGRWTSDCELVWINRGYGVYLFNHEWMGVCRASENGDRVYHPTQKPVEVMKWVLDRLKVPVGATVLDPYMGSGSTGVACLETGRRFVGIEIEADYFAIAQRRLAAAQPGLPFSREEKAQSAVEPSLPFTEVAP